MIRFLTVFFLCIGSLTGSLASAQEAPIPDPPPAAEPTYHSDDELGWVWAGGALGFTVGAVGGSFILQEAVNSEEVGVRVLLSISALALPALLTAGGLLGAGALAEDNEWNRDAGFLIASANVFALLGAGFGYSIGSVSELDSLGTAIATGAGALVLGGLGAILDATLMSDVRSSNRQGPMFGALGMSLLVGLVGALIGGIAQLEDPGDELLLISTSAGIAGSVLFWATASQ